MFQRSKSTTDPITFPSDLPLFYVPAVMRVGLGFGDIVVLVGRGHAVEASAARRNGVAPSDDTRDANAAVVSYSNDECGRRWLYSFFQCAA